ncbi:uncharacterized protein LOC128653573 [Bombina bombina]|uniref:uncharacterized protein LOC128653573 n=1 Tax=Bombina bombina TaxID=8345 RepID=UPI00235A4B8A|nr:uncharacterized protein LOC128653573 [Bombina bombina]
MLLLLFFCIMGSKGASSTCYDGNEPLCDSCSGFCTSGNGCFCIDDATVCIPTLCDLAPSECCPAGLYWNPSESCCTYELICIPPCLRDEICTDMKGLAVCVCNTSAVVKQSIKDLNTLQECSGDIMIISIAICQLNNLGYDYNTFKLNDKSANCSLMYSDIINDQRVLSIVVLPQEGWCGTTVMIDEPNIYYSNTLYIDQLKNAVIHHNPISFNFTCTYSLKMQISSMKPLYVSQYLQANGTSLSEDYATQNTDSKLNTLFRTFMAAYSDEKLTTLITIDEAFPLGKVIYLQLNAEVYNKQSFKLRVESCVATPDGNVNNENSVYLLRNGCPNKEAELYVNVIQNGESLEAKIAFSSFAIQNHSEVFISCDVRLCEENKICNLCQMDQMTNLSTAKPPSVDIPDEPLCSPQCLSDEVCVYISYVATCICNKNLYKTQNLIPSLTCNAGKILISVSKCLLSTRGYDYNNISLIDSSCAPSYIEVINNSAVVITEVKTMRGWCGTLMEIDAVKIYYSNTLNISVQKKSIITVNPFSFSFTCAYNLTLQTSLDVLLKVPACATDTSQPVSSHPVFTNPAIYSQILPVNQCIDNSCFFINLLSVRGEGSYTITMAVYKNSDYTMPIEDLDYVYVGIDVYLALSVMGADEDTFVLKVSECFATPNDRSDPMFVQLVRNGCPVNEVKTVIEQNAESLEARIRISAFAFQGYNTVNIFCDAWLCERNSSSCTKCTNDNSNFIQVTNPENKITCSPPCLSDEICVYSGGVATCVCNETTYRDKTVADLFSSLTCDGSLIYISINKCLLTALGYDYNLIHLIDKTCFVDNTVGIDSRAVVVLQVNLQGGLCGPMKVDADKLYYSNTLYIGVKKNTIIRVNPITFNFTCAYSLNLQANLIVPLQMSACAGNSEANNIPSTTMASLWDTTYTSPVASQPVHSGYLCTDDSCCSIHFTADSRESSYSLSLEAYKNSEKTEQLYQGDTLPVGSEISLVFDILDFSLKRFALRIMQCFATPNNNRNDPNYVLLMSGGCVNDDINSTIISNGESLMAKIQISTFKFTGYDHVYIFCDARLCDKISENCSVCTTNQEVISNHTQRSNLTDVVKSCASEELCVDVATTNASLNDVVIARQCEITNITLLISKCQLIQIGYDPSSLQFSSCRNSTESIIINYTRVEKILAAPITNWCGNEVKVNASHVVYSNFWYVKPISNGTNSTGEESVPYSCEYALYLEPQFLLSVWQDSGTLRVSEALKCTDNLCATFAINVDYRYSLDPGDTLEENTNLSVNIMRYNPDQQRFMVKLEELFISQDRKSTSTSRSQLMSKGLVTDPQYVSYELKKGLTYSTLIINTQLFVNKSSSNIFFSLRYCDLYTEDCCKFLI